MIDKIGDFVYIFEQIVLVSYLGSRLLLNTFYTLKAVVSLFSDVLPVNRTDEIKKLMFSFMSSALPTGRADFYCIENCEI